MLQKAGGLFQLLAEVDFGTTYGIKSLYYKSRTANPADAGQIRFANADLINWRNQANSGNLTLGVSASDKLQFNGVDIQSAISVSDTATIDLTLTGSTLTADIVAGSIANSLISNSAAIAYSKLDLAGSIVNADISNSAAIAYAKLNLAGAIVNADVSNSAAIAYSKLNLSGSIVNADISASAAIDFSKLASLSSGNILVGNGSNVAASVAMSGDITISNSGVTAIGSNKVTNGMLAQVATATFKGRVTGGSGNVEDLTATQATSLLNNFVGDSGSGGTKGLVPAPATGDAAAGKFLKADGSWTVPVGAGDVTGPGSSTDNGFVRFNGTTGKVLKDSPATIVNADVDAAAAIAYSKLNLSGSLLNADVNASAAIAFSKLAALTASRALVSDGSGVVSVATTTSTEIGYLSGVTSAVQTQLDAKIAKSLVTAKGNIIAASASSTPVAVAVGTDGQYLKADSGAAGGVSWTTPGTPTIQKFTSGSGTYTTPAGVKWIRVRMVGGGGGGGGGALDSSSGGTGGTGGNTTFGTTLLVANGGTGGVWEGLGGSGGSASLGTGPIGVAITGGYGDPGLRTAAANIALLPGANGAASPFGGAGGGGAFFGSGLNGIANTGSGGGGGSCSAFGTGAYGTGGGGGAGGYVDAIIVSPSSTYSYAVGAGGTAGTAGTSGLAGGVGGSGVIVVEEYYI